MTKMIKNKVGSKSDISKKQPARYSIVLRSEIFFELFITFELIINTIASVLTSWQVHQERICNVNIIGTNQRGEINKLAPLTLFRSARFAHFVTQAWKSKFKVNSLKYDSIHSTETKITMLIPRGPPQSIEFVFFFVCTRFFFCERSFNKVQRY